MTTNNAPQTTSQTTGQTTGRPAAASKSSAVRSLVTLLISALVIASLIPGLLNRYAAIYPRSAITSWFDTFKNQDNYPIIGAWLDELRLLEPQLFNAAYWIGVAGTSFLVVLLLYSANKRTKSMRGAGKSGLWLSLHIVLGAFTPVLILYHCNFSLGAFNSNFALWTMLTVAISGVVGRYLFTPLHKRFYEQRAKAHDVRDKIIDALQKLAKEPSETEDLIAYIRQFDAEAMVPNKRLLASIAKTGVMAAKSRYIEHQLQSRSQALINWQAQSNGWPGQLRDQWHLSMNNLNTGYIKAVRRATRAAIFERIFAIWEFLHSPLSIVMLLATLAHIVIVHTY